MLVRMMSPLDQLGDLHQLSTPALGLLDPAEVLAGADERAGDKAVGSVGPGDILECFGIVSARDQLDAGGNGLQVGQLVRGRGRDQDLETARCLGRGGRRGGRGGRRGGRGGRGCEEVAAVHEQQTSTGLSQRGSGNGPGVPGPRSRHQTRPELVWREGPAWMSVSFGNRQGQLRVAATW